MDELIKCECQLLIEGFDWGPSIGCIILKSNKFLDMDFINPDVFKVAVKKQNVFYETKIKHVQINAGEIRLYPINHPSYGYLSPMIYNHQTNRNKFMESTEISVELKEKIKINDLWINGFETPIRCDYIIPSIEHFSHGEYLFDHKITMNYSLYEPEEKLNMPLIIWLHGAGEGGTDYRVLLLGNPVTKLIEPEVQTIAGGACLLVPQCPTFWMDDGTGAYTLTGKSIYHKALHGLIEKVVYKNNKIDRQRIYIGGCSNGGYMVMNMLLHYPSDYAAAFPVCEAYYDKWLQDSDIQLLKKQPIWLTHAKSDQIVSFENFSNATYHRLVSAGGKDIHLSSFETVYDFSNKYFSTEGKPHVYNNHWSWIYTLNNQCITKINDIETDIFTWLFEHKAYSKD